MLAEPNTPVSRLEMSEPGWSKLSIKSVSDSASVMELCSDSLVAAFALPSARAMMASGENTAHATSVAKIKQLRERERERESFL